MSNNQNPEQLVEEARVFFNEKEFNSSIIQLKNALQVEPAHVEARWLLGSIYLILGDADSALKELEQAQNLGISEPKLKSLMLEALILKREFIEVIESTEIIDETSPFADIELSHRGTAYLGLGQIGNAENTFNEAIEINQESVVGRIGIARIEFVKRNIITSEEILVQLTDIAPEDDKIWNLLGFIRYSNDQVQESVDDYAKAVELNPYNIDAQLGYTRSLLSLEDIDSALVPIKAIESRFPAHPMTRFYRAYIAYLNNNFDRAKDLLLTLLRQTQNHQEALLLISNIYYNEENFEQTIEYLSRYVNLVPNHLPSIKLISYIHIQEGNHKKAIEIMEEAINTSYDAQLLALLGSAYLKIGESAKGLETLEYAFSLDPQAPNIRAELALGHLATGSPQKAIDNLESAIKLDPDFLRADILLVISHLQQKKYQEALSASRKLEAKDPDNLLAYNFEGTALIGLGEYESAIEVFDNILTRNSEFVPALWNLALIDLNNGDLISGKSKLEKVLSIEPGNVNVLVELAKIEGSSGNEAKMLELLQTARVSNRAAIQPRIILANYYLEKLSVQDMYDVINEAYEVSPNNPEVLFLLGKSQRLNNMNESALQSFQSILDIEPDNKNAIIEFAVAQFELGKYSEASQSISKVLMDDPTDYDSLVLTLRIEIAENRFSNARDQLEIIKTSYPDISDIYELNGDILVAEKQYNEAINQYKKALEQEENKTRVIKLAGMYNVTENQDESWNLLEEWSRKNPEDNDINLILGNGYAENQRLIRASEIYMSMLNRDPENIAALNNLAWVYFRLNNIQAIEYAEKAYVLNPDRPEVVDTLGWILLNNGNTERGYNLIRSAFNGKPYSPNIIYHYAYALNSVGERQKAISHLTKLIQGDQVFESRGDAEKLLSALQ